MRQKQSGFIVQLLSNFNQQFTIMLKSVLSFITLFLCISLSHVYPFTAYPKTFGEGCFNFLEVDPNATFNVGDELTVNNCVGIFSEFYFLDGTPHNLGQANILNGNLFMGNTNITYTFTPAVDALQFTYLDQGGNVNLIVNGDIATVEDFTDLHGVTLGGVSIVSNTPGIVELIGTINSVSMGGQELSLLDICPPDVEPNDCGFICDRCNIFIGQDAGINNTTGDFNTFLGHSAGQKNTTGLTNTFIGKFAGRENTVGISNTYLGELAGLLGTTGDENTFIGQEAGRENTTGSSNTFVGEDAGLSNTIGDLNSFFGCNAGVNADQSNRNTFIGSFAGQSSFEGVNNTYLGVFTGQENTLGVNNTFLGSYAGRKSLTGQFNTYVGMSAGHDNLEGSANVFLGYQAGFNEKGSNRLYIANSATSNPLIYGAFDRKIVNINGALGVGIQNPERPIHLRATNAIFRIDRDRNDPGFAIVRYDQGFNNVWKSFYFYTRGDGPNDGKFVIADWGQNVSGASTARMVIANNGNVGIGNFLFVDPSQKLTVNGNVLATGSYITSDKRFKRHIKILPQGIRKYY